MKYLCHICRNVLGKVHSVLNAHISFKPHATHCFIWKYMLRWDLCGRYVPGIKPIKVSKQTQDWKMARIKMSFRPGKVLTNSDGEPI